MFLPVFLTLTRLVRVAPDVFGLPQRVVVVTCVNPQVVTPTRPDRVAAGFVRLPQGVPVPTQGPVVWCTLTRLVRVTVSDRIGPSVGCLVDRQRLRFGFRHHWFPCSSVSAQRGDDGRFGSTLGQTLASDQKVPAVPDGLGAP